MHASRQNPSDENLKTVDENVEQMLQPSQKLQETSRSYLFTLSWDLPGTLIWYVLTSSKFSQDNLMVFTFSFSFERLKSSQNV